jgi:hypothetical protein
MLVTTYMPAQSKNPEIHNVNHLSLFTEEIFGAI